VLAKLNVHSRTQIATWAVAHDLLRTPPASFEP